MKIFDLHCDIGSDIEVSLQKGIQNPFNSRHLENLMKGEVQYVCCACYFIGKESWADMAKNIEDVDRVLSESDVVFVRNKEDFHTLGKVNPIISIEGMCGIKENPREKVQFMAKHHVKIASLAWNDENYLATGNSGDVTRGISEAGYEVIDEMDKCGIILDVSHLNEASFWDIIKNTKGKVCATHSNAKALCGVDRNLTNQQIRAIAARGGLIGMNACGDFVHDDKDKQDAYHLALHAKYIADLVGVKHVACGFDFMDFLDEYGADEMATGLKGAHEAQNFVKALYEVGFNEEEVEAICYKNAVSFFVD